MHFALNGNYEFLQGLFYALFGSCWKREQTDLPSKNVT